MSCFFGLGVAGKDGLGGYEVENGRCSARRILCRLGDSASWLSLERTLVFNRILDNKSDYMMFRRARISYFSMKYILDLNASSILNTYSLSSYPTLSA